MKDIHDIKGLIEIPIPWLSFLLLALFLLSLCTLAGWWIWRWRKKRQTTPTVEKPVNKVGCYQQALHDLKQLNPQTQASSEFYIQLESILKHFLHQTSDQTPEQSVLSFTTSQLLAYLKAQSLLTPDLQNCLQHGLYAKFAEHDLPTLAMQDDLQIIVSWFENYKRTLITV